MLSFARFRQSAAFAEKSDSKRAGSNTCVLIVLANMHAKQEHEIVEIRHSLALNQLRNASMLELGRGTLPKMLDAGSVYGQVPSSRSRPRGRGACHGAWACMLKFTYYYALLVV